MIWAVGVGGALVLWGDAKPHRHLLNQLQLMPSVRPWLTKFFTIRGCNETGYQSSRFGGDAARRQGPPQFAARCAHHAFCARFFAGTRKFQRLSIASERSQGGGNCQTSHLQQSQKRNRKFFQLLTDP